MDVLIHAIQIDPPGVDWPNEVARSNGSLRTPYGAKRIKRVIDTTSDNPNGYVCRTLAPELDEGTWFVVAIYTEPDKVGMVWGTWHFVVEEPPKIVRPVR